MHHSSNVILTTHSAWWVSVLIILLCLFFVRGYPQALILAGGFSNLLDRLSYGGVVDYFFLGSLAFNVADVAIIVGVVLVLYSFRVRAGLV